MYLFLELTFTIALSLLLPLLFIKLLSMTTNFETNEKVAVIRLDRDHDHDREVTEEAVRIVKKVDENIEDDWEGIERSELEKCFGAAVVFVGSKSYANRVADLSNDVKLKLYGYHRIATNGPCSEPQPMALKFSARAKWNAWQQLGNMRPELAMEQYISLLSESVPDWMANYPYENVELASADTRAFATPT
ncbi:putative FERM/acyl-CoA-binding protein, 3-helical bundle [Lupinus albus]|uniref:Putative FERM/acyl-CoA-binding protein, 3-helical bundle n=1 Tax=Lupinus albus TaxID=3870 RepID=A0A6A4PYN4_LUPAL|nr:putative FERM/acyl-CoA-binding protein, 3-helical bundle [Lupinus albus]